MTGSPIRVSVLPELSRSSGRLLSGSVRPGVPVHAACFIRERRIVLEETLLGDRAMLRLILMHELFHFVWPRLSNRTRAEFSQVLLGERQAGARGELGESSAVQKEGERCWREYACESFCDTAAWFCSGFDEHPAFTLAARWRKRRAAWFRMLIAGAPLKY